MTMLASAFSLCLALAGAPGDPAPGTPEFFVAQSVAGMQGQREILRERYRLGEESHWSIDQDAGTLTLEFADGTVATAPVQIVGTFNPRDGTFMWGWANDAVDARLRRAANRARGWGAENGVERYTTAKLDSSLAEAWEFTAVAARLDEATGTYSVNTDGPAVFMTFGTIEFSKPARGGDGEIARTTPPRSGR
jgi:hypothetical protein